MWYFLAWIVLGPLIGLIAGDERGRPFSGAVLGLLFGPVGWIIAALQQPDAEHQARFELAVEERKRWLIVVRDQYGGNERAAKRAHRAASADAASASRNPSMPMARPMSDDEAFAQWRGEKKTEPH